MGALLLDDVGQLLRGLEATQQELSALYREKRTALIRGRSDELMQIATAETALAERLRSLLGRRQQILAEARRAGVDGADSIQDLVGALGEDGGRELPNRIERARRRADDLRRETWIHWVIAHRAYSHYTQLVELIAHCGKKSPTYGRGANEETPGGAIFDASV